MLKFLIIVLMLPLSGCGSLSYYHQAISGHWDLMSRRIAIDKLISTPATDPELKRKLLLVSAARDFASHELNLSDNGSYRSYADLGREYVVWNVFATGELSLEPVPSCFILVGCLSYRGFFDPDHALAHANALKREGYEVFVAGVAAYSTLGWFDDPVLNTMLVWDDERIIEVIFHELAHQLLYAKNDSVFNESFATIVADVGVERWLQSNQASVSEHLTRYTRREQFNELLLRYRSKLDSIYKGVQTDELKRFAKSEVFRQLAADYAVLKQDWGNYTGYDSWMNSDLNNAKIASVATYHDYVLGLRTILNDVDNDLTRFYAIAKSLALLPEIQRQQCLSSSHGGSSCANEFTTNE
ncbi:MAG: aminopeptidase [Proteobacteria bacterium]|nr:aminopeptidase [Pseudomonadota bacterium]